jgi:hypothetical protein
LDTAVTAALQSWASHATPDDLRAGPQARDLGGREAIAAVAGELAASPFFPYLIDVAGNDDTPAGDEVTTLLDQAVLQGVAEHSRHSSYVSAITRLLAHPELASRLGRPLEGALQRRAEAAISPGADTATAAIGAAALQAWLHLCSSRAVRQHRLLAFLTDLPDTVAELPLPMAQGLPRVAGLAHERFGDEELITLLNRLAGIPEAEADAGFELALADLRRALNADSRGAFIHAISSARSGFAAVEAADEARHDAQAYGAALDAIMAFERPDPADLHDAATRLNAAVSQHIAWLSGNYLPTWTWTRAQAEASWLQLSAVLTAAAGSLHEACWYHPSQALAALLDAYMAARSFITIEASGTARGVELLIRPTIEGAFIRDASRLALLDHALAHDPLFTEDEGAQRLHAAIHTALNAIEYSRPPSASAEGDDGLGKEPSRLMAVLQLHGIKNADELVAGMSQPVQDVMEALLWNDEIAHSGTGNVKIERKLRELLQELATSPDWETAGGPFKVLLSQTILYLASRYDISSTMGGERTAFLHSNEPKSVLERALQQDYFDWLKQGPLYNTVMPEAINRGRGRVDILVRFRDVSFSVECKRELKDASRTGLRDYLGQAAVYTDTDAALGILLVLDLTTPATGAPDLFSSIWVEQVQREREDQSRYIVVARLPGNTRDPSATRTPVHVH